MFSTSLRTIDLTGSPCIANPSSTFVMCNRKNCEEVSPSLWQALRRRDCPTSASAGQTEAVFGHRLHRLCGALFKRTTARS